MTSIDTLRAPRLPTLRALVPALAAALLAACTVGPDFVRPDPVGPGAQAPTAFARAADEAGTAIATDATSTVAPAPTDDAFWRSRALARS